MYRENQNMLNEIADIARVAKSRWQTADGKWWTNDGSGKKPYTPKAGGAPLTSSGMAARSKQQNGALSSSDSEARAKRQKREESFKKISPHMNADAPSAASSAPNTGNTTTKPAHMIKNVKMISPKSAISMYKNHLNSDPEFASHEGERVGAMMGTGKASLSELHESLDKTDPMAAHRDINQAYTSYHAKKNPPA